MNLNRFLFLKNMSSNRALPYLTVSDALKELKSRLKYAEPKLNVREVEILVDFIDRECGVSKRKEFKEEEVKELREYVKIFFIS